MGDPEYPWYQVIDYEDDILQGDIIKNCPIIIPPKDMIKISLGETPEERPVAKTYNVVIMSQSCDLKYQRLEYVLVCPIKLYSKLCEQKTHFRSSKYKKGLKDGLVPGYHLLNGCGESGIGFEHSVVAFRQVFAVDFDFLYGYAQSNLPRLRLRPPYREGLSQAFARFFMRVGYPVEIDDFD